MQNRFFFLILVLALLGGCTLRRTEPAPTPAVTAPPAEESAPTTGIVLSQLVADNHSVSPGEAGTFPDYICLRNDGTETEIMDGWHLSQKAGRLGYTLPRTELQPGESLTVWCDGWNRDYHTNFSLSAEGESVVLSDQEGRVFWEVSYPPQEEDSIYRRMEDGSYTAADGAAPKASRPEGLIISECTSFNFSYADVGKEYYDWVELYNGGSETITLADYTLSDKRDPGEALPMKDYTLAPGEYVVILCAGEDTPVSRWPVQPISLNAAREAIYLRTREGELLDYCSLHDIPLGGSYGREGEDWVWFTEPTPGRPNAGGRQAVSSSVSVDTPEGCYEGVEKLVVKLSAPGEIRYTLDGSEPSEESLLYTGELTFSGTAVLRARCYEEGKCPGPISGWSYIINEGHSLPVASVIVDPVGFFEPKWRDWPGIYYVAANTIEPEHLTDLSFFEEGGGFHAQSTISLHGASTRESREKKSMKLTFRNAYGGDVYYDLFGEGEERFHSLTFRSGYMEDNTLLRDSICQSTAIASGAKVLCLRNRYCVLYINGEYWGIYSLREAYSKAYAADHLNSSEDEVQIVRSKVRPNFEPDMVKLFSHLTMNRYWTQQDYDMVAGLIDLESLADWMVLEAYFYNYDLPGNIRYVRATADSKFLYAFFDLDFGLRKTQLDWMYVCDTANQFGLITTPIISIPEFQELLFERMALLYEQGLSAETMLGYLDQYTRELSPELEREYERWSAGKADTEKMVEEMRDLIVADRQERCFSSLCKKIYRDEAAAREAYFGDKPFA